MIAVIDDGIGFDPSAESLGFGVISMRERASSLGADFKIESDPSAGTEVKVSL
jgi:signal transduction histidine kinase